MVNRTMTLDELKAVRDKFAKKKAKATRFVATMRAVEGMEQEFDDALSNAIDEIERLGRSVSHDKN